MNKSDEEFINVAKQLREHFYTLENDLHNEVDNKLKMLKIIKLALNDLSYFNFDNVSEDDLVLLKNEELGIKIKNVSVLIKKFGIK